MIATAPWKPVRSLESLYDAVAIIGFPAVLKIAENGYDGKGQVVIRTMEEVPNAWNIINRRDK